MPCFQILSLLVGFLILDRNVTSTAYNMLTHYSIYYIKVFQDNLLIYNSASQKNMKAEIRTIYYFT
jgi:hypothetical protein